MERDTQIGPVVATAFRLRAAWVVSLLLWPAVACGQGVVFPRVVHPGGSQRYVLRILNGRDVPVVGIELTFPEGARVVSFAEVQGWTLEVVPDRAGRVVRAIWTGRLPVMRFVEFPFVAVNPDREATLVWPAVQLYEGGERVEWTGPEGSDNPASITHVVARDRIDFSSWLAGGALILALVSLGIALRPSKA